MEETKLNGKPIYAALMKVQLELKAPKNLNTHYGNGGKGFAYRNAEAILEAAKPLLNENDLVVLLTDSIEQVGDRFYVKATARLIEIITGDVIETTAYARESLTKQGNDPAQITGACSSYARKYALCGLFAIDDTKDPDTDEYHEGTEARYPQQNRAGARSGGNASTYTRNGVGGAQTGAQAQETADDEYDKRTLLHRITEEMQRTSASSAEVSAITQEKYGKSGAKVMNEIELKDLADNFETYLAEMMQKKAAS